MNTIYSFAPFRRFNLGVHARATSGNGIQLGQNVFSQLLKDVGLPRDIESLITNLPEEEKSFNRQRWDECKAMGLTTSKGAACALAVIADIKAGKTSPTTATAMPAYQQPSSFPVLPVLLGLAAAGGLVWYLSSRAK